MGFTPRTVLAFDSEARLRTRDAAHEHTVDQVVEMLVRLIDLRRPGSADRGQRLASLSRRLAERFQVPDMYLPDLERAARLHELGMVADPEVVDSLPGTNTSENWRAFVVGAHTLQHVDRLSAAASVIAAIAENWDGSGYPGHRQQGQIPLRSRILRVLIDYIGSGAKPSALDAMREHAATWYDPMVITQLAPICGQVDDIVRTSPKWRVPIAKLEVGMVLAEDLSTDAGIKLLSAGTTLTAQSLDIVRRRDLSDPMTNGAWVTPGVV